MGRERLNSHNFKNSSVQHHYDNKQISLCIWSSRHSHSYLKQGGKYPITNAMHLPVLRSATFHHGTVPEMFSTTHTCSGKPNQTKPNPKPEEFPQCDEPAATQARVLSNQCCSITTPGWPLARVEIYWRTVLVLQRLTPWPTLVQSASVLLFL